ncbi:hypothetical protein RB595_004877 [Gaeumannomyces hyphopodioides]
MLPPIDRSGFHLAIICALRIESDAVRLLFDDIYEKKYGRETGDTNTYTTGRIGNHAVVLLLLPGIGMEASAAGARSLQSSYTNIKLALIVGVCGGLPQIRGRDAFLGDVIISKSILNHDFGRRYPDKFVVRSTEDTLGQTNNDIRGLLELLEGKDELGRLQKKARANLVTLQAAATAADKEWGTSYSPPTDATDRMFRADYEHSHHREDCDDCDADPPRFCERASRLSCDDVGCKTRLCTPRKNRQQERPVELVPQVFMGRVASGNAVMKSGKHRDAVAKEHDVIAFEMEGAGAWKEVPCIVVKGICDYADSHKNKEWQNFAAATAASVAAAILDRYEVAGGAMEGVSDERRSNSDGRNSNTTNSHVTTIDNSNRSNTITNNNYSSGGGAMIWGNNNTINTYKPPQPLLGCLRSLAFPQMHNRSHDIDRAVTGTCEWLLRHEMYRSWVACDRGLLWIKGKPGSGKSTLLKYALDNRGRMPGARDLILSFFFHGRGDELQRSPLGLFRSLLHQVLGQVPDALPDLVDTFEKKRQQIGEPGEKWQWHKKELQRFFELSLPNVLKTRSIWLFVDALDECGERNAVDLVEWFESLLQNPFRICFTCRHYPILALEDGAFEICLEHENREDISTYVRNQLSTFSKRTSPTIPALITARAQGVFMWARLVVKQALDLERDGEPLGVIEAAIQSIPEDLDALYRTLLQSMGSDSLKLVQWICFSTRPLTTDELQWAMAIDPNGTHESLDECQRSNDFITNDKINRRIRVLSRGLAEIVPSSNAQVVQFIHQSVKDFVEKGLSVLDSSSTSAIGMAHHRLSKTCIRYLAMKEIGQSTGYGRHDFPFLHYATTSWVAHAKQSDARSVRQEDLLKFFGWPSEALVELWVRIYGTLEKYSRDRPAQGTSLGHVASRYKVVGLLSAIMQKADRIGIDIGIDSRDENARTPLSFAAENGHEAVVELLLATGKVDVDSKDEQGRTPLSWAAANGHEAVIKLLLATGRVDVESKDERGRTPLLYAAENVHEAIVKLLLATGKVDVDLKDRGGWAPLSCAAQNGREAGDHPSRLASQHELAGDYAARSGDNQSGWRPRFSGEVFGQHTPPATVSGYTRDSGYVSGATGTSKGKEPSQLQSPINEEPSQPQTPICEEFEGNAEGRGEQDENDETYSGGRYQYSKAGSVSEERVGRFVSEMARLLIAALPPSDPDDSTPQRLGPVLPRILQAFALMIGHCAPTATHQAVMFFVHKNQSAIVDRFRDIYARGEGGDDDSDDEKPQTSIDQAQQGPVGNMLGRFFSDLPSFSEEMEVGEASEGNTIDEEHEQDSHDSEPADIHDPEASSMSEITIYRDCVVKSSAYEWLRGALSVEIIQTPAIPDIRSKIRNTVLRLLDSSRKEQSLSRTRPTEPHRVSFEMEWDPRSFVEEQRYEEERPEDAIGMAITLTGSSQDCQATATSQYLSQTWPSGGSHMMQVIRRLLRGEPGDRQSATWPDGTTLTVRSNGPKLMVTAHGPAPSIAEIAEQLAWVGAALRPSPQEQGVCYCTPYIKYLGEGDGSDSTPGTSPTPESSFVIGFSFTSVDDEGANGQCWHDMFRNPVIVRGYPISRRTATQTGLEMPLNIMARMVKADHVMPFSSTWYLKGFSSMLALTESRNDVLLWHHIYNRDGDHVSYSDHTAKSPIDITVSQLQNARHVVGWCSDVKLYAGALENANYKIRDSGLSRPHSTWTLDKVSISGGQFVSGGISIAVGVRDKPIHLGRDNYFDKMRWVDGQHAILWDEGDKRGWLVNGPSALLHMVRASLEYDREWARTRAGLSDILFSKDDMEDPKQPHTPNSALSVLLSEKNKGLRIFVKEVDESDDEKPQPKTTYKRFKHVVEEQYNLFEQMVDHQLRPKDGVDFKLRLRKYLKGWDFRDLTVTAKTEPIYARLKTFKGVTCNWVDFTRERSVITILGKGFGDIIRPVNAASMCGDWARVPAGRYYLAACVSDLKAVMKLGFDERHFTTPIHVCKGLDWHATDRLFRPCRCGKMTGEDVKHSDDIAQVLVPSSTLFQKTPKTSGSVELGNMGAVIFGFSSIPRSERPDEDSSEEEVVAETLGEANIFHDSGIGTSPTPTATGGSGSRAQAGTRPVRAGEVSDAIAAAGPSRAQESAGQADKAVPPDQHAPGESFGRAADDRTDAPVEGLPGRTDDDADKPASGHGTAQPPTTAPRSRGEQSTPEGAAEHGGTAQGNVPRGGVRTRLKLWFAKAKLAWRFRGEQRQ